MKISKSRSFFFVFTGVILLVIGSNSVLASTSESGFSSQHLYNIWMLISGILVFFMNAGFAMLEAGNCSTKNAVNILAKNLIVFCVASIAYGLIGFSIMFGDSNSGLIGNFQPFLLSSNSFVSLTNPGAFPSNGFQSLMQSWPDRSLYTIFFFQLTFAGTVATIVSGAVAERIRFMAFILFTIFLTAFLYPVLGYWVWGSKGWLYENLNFHDFAGSTVIHSVGGVAALTGAHLLGRRKDWNPERGLEAHNQALSALGCFILWLGWFGFNGGSALYLLNIPQVLLNTMLAAAAGGFIATIVSYFIYPSLSSMINGVLAGLVSITASSAYVTPFHALVIGAVGGLIVIIIEQILRNFGTDDPVSAVPVHLGGGFWGTIAVGFFALDNQSSLSEFRHMYAIGTQVIYQFFGWLVVCTVTIIFSYLAWLLIGAILHWWNDPDDIPIDVFTRLLGPKAAKFVQAGLRVTVEDEDSGSDGYIKE